MKMAIIAALMVAGFAVDATAAEPGMPVPSESPGNWINDEDYPASEREKGISGTTGVRLIVGTAGEAKSCEVAESSGSQTLDTTACALLKARASFFPARDGKGRKVESVFTTRVRWNLPAVQLNAGTMARSFTIFVDISTEGVVENCRMEKSGNFPPGVRPVRAVSHWAQGAVHCRSGRSGHIRPYDSESGGRIPAPIARRPIAHPAKSALQGRAEELIFTPLPLRPRP
ncbi:MAG: energy transducer TonB [Sphingobium sp.]